MYPFDETFRREVADRCAAFTRLAAIGTNTELKRAAVAITLVEAQDPDTTAFLLTRRAAGLRAHGNQWALPGGRCEDGETAVEAALRELDEELGLALAADQVLGMLDDYPTRSGYVVTPIVAWARQSRHIRPNDQEVASVHRIPLLEIAPVDAVDFVTIPESDRPVVRVRINGDLVHAPTAAMIYQFRELLAGRTTRVAELEQPVFAWR